MSETTASLPPTQHLSVSRSSFFWASWWLFAAMLVGYIWNVKPSMSPNDASRWDTIWSLVEYGTYEIFDTANFGDKQQFLTIDKVKRRYDGVMISSKPPLFPTVAAGVVEVAKLVLQKSFSKDTRVPERPTIPGSINIYSKIVLFVFNVVPMLVVLWLFRRWLEREGYSEYAWLYALSAFALGTLMTGYIVTLNNHVVAATGAFASLYNLSRIWRDGCREYWRFALLGLLAGWTAANELPAGVLVVGILLIAFVLDWKKTLLGLCPPLALVTAAFFYTNYLAIGDPAHPDDYRNFIPAYLQKDLYQEDAMGEPSYWARTDKSGIDALNENPEPWYIYFANMTIGHHGLFSLTPIFLFSLAGLAIAFLQPSLRMRGLAVLVLCMSLIVFCFYLFFTTEHNYGGFCHGLRWMVWLMPLWLMFLPACSDRIAGMRVWVILAWAALCVSVMTVFDTWYNPWSRAWLHRILLYFNVIDY